MSRRTRFRLITVPSAFSVCVIIRLPKKGYFRCNSSIRRINASASASGSTAS